MNASKIYLVLTLLLISLFYNCTTNEDNIAETNHFMRTVNEFYEAVNTGNTDKRLSMFTPDAKMLPNFGDLIELNDSAKAKIKSYDDNWVFRIKDLKHVEIEVKDSIAYTVNTYYYTFHPTDSMPQWHRTKNVHIWKKQNDGSWKLHIDIWNSSVTQN